ncbi:MAG TPA: hypothetical protein VHZ98_02010 [Galbitalea sp.]|nr:hypothetical protein [Galbitalea sp.]
MDAGYVNNYSASQARANIKDILDATGSGRAVTVERDSRTSAVVDGERLRKHFASTVTTKPEAVMDDGAWVLTIPGLPIAVEANLYEEAITELVCALQEYAEDWHGRLGQAPNHAGNWSLVQLVELSTEEQLKRWVTGHIE